MKKWWVDIYHLNGYQNPVISFYSLFVYNQLAIINATELREKPTAYKQWAFEGLSNLNSRTE
jgi:hypothetical protein